MWQTWLRLAFAALVSLVVVGCGGDDGAGTGDGNGADDGNGDDTAGPNPLIEQIEGAWEITSAIRITTDADGNERRETIERHSHFGPYVGKYDWVQPADPDHPDCEVPDRPYRQSLGPPGDACVDWFDVNWFDDHFILDGDRARAHIVYRNPTSPCGEYHMEGRFLDEGHRFEYMVEDTVSDAEICADIEPHRLEVKMRWYTARCWDTITDEYGCGMIPSPENIPPD